MTTEWTKTQTMNPQPKPVGKSLAAYYDSNRKDYWIQDNRKNWIEVSESSLRRHLKAGGLSSECPRGELLSEVDTALNRFQMDCAVSYAGPLAGCQKGAIEQCGNRILVTSSLRLVQPRKGSFPLFSALLRNLLFDEVRDQRPFFLGWLKTSYEALRKEVRRPGQALALAGPPDSGKSLLQNLITEVLGGRAAKPYRYMSGVTPFNGDLFGAEHLMIEDDCASTDLRARREFGVRIKEFTVNTVQSCHAKNRQAISLEPFWRLSISLNAEPENLAILPPIDESLEDKIILLRANLHPMPMDTKTIEGRERFWKGLNDELPAVVAYLLEWQIPPDLGCARFGIKSWHHPVLLKAIDALSPELRLLSLIDAVLFADHGAVPEPPSLSASVLERMLVASTMKYEARSLLNWPNACGTYLGRLAKKKPHRVQEDRTAGSRLWRINPPRTADGK